MIERKFLQPSPIIWTDPIWDGSGVVVSPWHWMWLMKTKAESSPVKAIKEAGHGWVMGMGLAVHGDWDIWEFNKNQVGTKRDR